MPRSSFIPALAVTAAIAATSAGAQDRSRDRVVNPALDGITACRQIANPQERLSCFDKAAAGLETAQAKGDLIVMNRAEVQEKRRRLFGIALPDFNLFGGGDKRGEEAEAITEIESTVRSAQQQPGGKWAITLADGARWLQIDSANLNFEPLPGQAVRIRRAAMGSYLANINRQRAIRVRRIL